MRYFVIRLVAGAFSSLLLLLGVPALSAPKAQDVAVNAFHFEDPGSPPPFAPAEFAPYIGRGTLTFVVRPHVLLKDGEALRADDSNDAYLYPDTAFTRWMLEKYAFLANGNDDWQKISLDFPGQGFPKLPNLLTASGETYIHPGSTAVHATRCQADGICVFRGLRPGKYIFFGQLWKYHSACQAPMTHVDYDPITGISQVHELAPGLCGAKADWGVVLTSSASYRIQQDNQIANDDSLRIAAYYTEK
jgi:hypothetical protein